MSLSKVVLSGRVIRPPEKRFTPNNNIAVADFSIALESPPRQDGTVESHPIKIITWRDLAERVSQDLKKGDLVAVDGRLQLNSYTNSEGQRRRDLEVDAVNVENLTAAVNRDGAPAPAAGRVVVKAGAKQGKGPNDMSSDDLDALFANEDEIPF